MSRRSASWAGFVRRALRDPATSPLRRARIEAGLSIPELAEAAYISRGHMGALDRSGALPPKGLRVHLSRALDRPEEELWPAA